MQAVCSFWVRLWHNLPSLFAAEKLGTLTKGGRHSGRRSWLQLEILEDRLTPAVPTVLVNTPWSGFFTGSSFQATGTVNGDSTLEGVSLTFDYQQQDDSDWIDLGSAAPSDAGNYEVTAFFAGSANYDPSQSAPADFTIYAAMPILTANLPYSSTYNGQPFVATNISIAGVVAGVDDTPSSSLQGVPLVVDYQNTDTQQDYGAVAPTDPGNYEVSVSFAGSTDYSATSLWSGFTIYAAMPLLTANLPYSSTYNGQPFAATNISIAGVVAGVDDTPSSSLQGVPLVVDYQNVDTGQDYGTTAPVDPGNYTVSVSYAGSTDYSPVYSSSYFSIYQAMPTVTVSDAGGVMNGTAFPATATVAGVVPGVDDTPNSTLQGVGLTLDYQQWLNGSWTDLGSTAPSAAGDYQVTASFPGSTDYSSVSASTWFSITSPSVSLLFPGDQTSTEGDLVNLGLSASDSASNPLLYSATNLPPGLSLDPLSGLITGTIAAGADVNSPYAVTLTATDSVDSSASATQNFQWAVSADDGGLTPQQQMRKQQIEARLMAINAALPDARRAAEAQETAVDNLEASIDQYLELMRNLNPQIDALQRDIQSGIQFAAMLRSMGRISDAEEVDRRIDTLESQLNGPTGLRTRYNQLAANKRDAENALPAAERLKFNLKQDVINLESEKSGLEIQLQSIRPQNIH